MDRQKIATNLQFAFALADVIVATVNESEHEFGVPLGILYTGLLQGVPGITFDAFNTVVAVVVDAGKVRRTGDVLFPIGSEKR